jgi:hypothetical protein
VRAAGAVAAPAVLLVALLAWPLFFTQAVFNEDWINHLWFIWHQSVALRENHAPSLFLSYSHGVFYPQYLFYGGTLDTLAGLLALLLGEAPLQAYLLTYLLAFAAAYGGWYWMARMAGLGRWWAHVPGLVFVTSSYYITSIYTRGGWPEVVAISAMTLMMASGLSVLRAGSLRAWPAAALALATVVFFGSHNITMLWGVTTLALAAVAILVCVPQARRSVTRAGVLRVACIVVPAALVNAWFLLPAVAYKSETLIGGSYESTEALVRSTVGLVSVKHLLTVSRASATAPSIPFALSLPVLEIAWVLLTIAIVLVRGPRGIWRRMLLVVAALTVLVGLVMTHADLLLSLPHIYASVQYTYRLEAYILEGISAAVLIALLLARGPGRSRQLWRLALVPLLAISVIGAIEQTAEYPTYPTSTARLSAFDSYLKPPLTKTIWSDYLDPNLQSMRISGARPPVVEFPPGATRGDRASATVRAAPGQLVYSNLAANPHLVAVSGARIVGLGPEYNDVLEIAPVAGARGGATRAVTISVSTAHSTPIVLGRLLSLLGLAGLAAVFAALLAARLRLRRGAARS